MVLDLCVSLPNLKTSQAGFNGLESSPVESWCMTKELKHGNNYIMHFYQEVQMAVLQYLMLYFVQIHSSLGV